MTPNEFNHAKAHDPSYGEGDQSPAITARLIVTRIEAMCKGYLRMKHQLQILAAVADQVRCAWVVENGPCYPETDLGYALGELERTLCDLAMEGGDDERHPLDE